MSKRKHKPKQKHTQQDAKQKVERTPVVDGVVITAKEQPSSPQRENTKGKAKEESTMGFREMAKRSSFTDWCLAVFTLALVATSIYQFVLMRGQLDAMRKDQRPWIKISMTSFPTANQVLAPIGGTLHFVNNGKTPARGIVHGTFIVETVKNGEQPKLDYPPPRHRFMTGMMMPNDTPVDMEVQRMSLDASNNPHPAPFTAPEVEDFKQAKIFFVVYGTVYYADFFGTSHWTKFCAVMLAHEMPSDATFTGEKCTNYDDVDEN